MDTIAIQKYDENFGRVLRKTGHGVRGKGVVLRSAPVGRKGKILGSISEAVSLALRNMFGMVTGKDKKEILSSSSEGEEESTFIIFY